MVVRRELDHNCMFCLLLSLEVAKKILNNCFGLSENCLLRMILHVLSGDVVGTDVMRLLHAPMPRMPMYPPGIIAENSRTRS